MQTNRFRMFVIIAIFGMLLSGCNGLGAQPTATPTATNTPEPTATATVAPTNTAAPTQTPTEEIEYPRFFDVAEGGYSFELPEDESPWGGLNVTISGVETMIEDAAGEMVIYIASGVVDYELNVDEEIQALSTDIGYEGVVIDPEGIEVDGHSARRATVSMTYSGIDILMEFLLIDAGNNHLIIVNSNVFGEDLVARWDEELLPLQTVILDTFQITELDAAATGGDCTVSDDATYGYSEDNPIRVGGDWLEGPSRERAFLDNLLGPNGEMISYERIGSHDYGDTILDVYQITYSGLSTPITLYIDEYSWGTLYAPVGFTCSGAFSITEP